MLPVTTIPANENPAGYTPNIDGEFFPLSLTAALATGQFHHVPVIQGSNHDEWRLFTALDFDLTASGPIANNETAYEAALATLAGPAAPLVAAQYPLASFPSADIAFATAGTDVVCACPALGADLIDGMVTRVRWATRETLLVPVRNERSRVGHITGDTGKVDRRREGVGPAGALQLNPGLTHARWHERKRGWKNRVR